MLGSQTNISSVIKAPFDSIYSSYPDELAEHATQLAAVAYLEQSAEVVVPEEDTQLVILEIFSQAKQSEISSIKE